MRYQKGEAVVDWQGLFEEYEGGGKSLRAFAKEKGMDAGNLSRQFKRIKAGGTVAGETPNLPDEGSTPSPVATIPVCTQPSPYPTSPAIIALNKRIKELEASNKDLFDKVLELQEALNEERQKKTKDKTPKGETKKYGEYCRHGLLYCPICREAA